mmetsp:Transcript_42478/g.85902  ORF Transcript_42478/g.85902 Transcript_42478/m.85902 type:complete len:217 (-) Transcript_42478:124-774(-)
MKLLLPDHFNPRSLVLVYLLFILSLLNADGLSSGAAPPWSISVADPSDAQAIRQRVFKARMNPLFLDPKNFMVARVNKDDNKDFGDNAIVACAQLRKIDDQDDGSNPECLELASLIVDEPFQGKGLGTALVLELLQKRAMPVGARVYLLTLKRTVPFYEKLGFVECRRQQREEGDQVSAEAIPPPNSMRLEMAAGSVVASVFAGDSLVCMCRDTGA